MWTLFSDMAGHAFHEAGGYHRWRNRSSLSSGGTWVVNGSTTRTTTAELLHGSVPQTFITASRRTIEGKG